MSLHDVPMMFLSLAILFFAIVRIRALGSKAGEMPIPSDLTTLQLRPQGNESTRNS